MSTTNIYEDILANINAEKRAWCQGAWDVHEDGRVDDDGDVHYEGTDGKVISRCLVSHVDLALGTSYIKPNGKRFVSKDIKKWRRREKVLAHLFGLLPKDVANRVAGNQYGLTADEVTPSELSKDDLAWLNGGERISTRMTNLMVTFNDSSETTKAKVRNLLKKAAKRHPED